MLHGKPPDIDRHESRQNGSWKEFSEQFVILQHKRKQNADCKCCQTAETGNDTDIFISQDKSDYVIDRIHKNIDDTW